jgi:hypothetical protein
MLKASPCQHDKACRLGQRAARRALLAVQLRAASSNEVGTGDATDRHIRISSRQIGCDVRTWPFWKAA